MKKNKWITLFLILGSINCKAATNWDELIETAKLAEIENVKVDDAGYVQMKIAKWPDGKIRFMGFSSYGNSAKMKLTIHSVKNDVEKVCNDYVLYKKSFPAELTFSVSPIADNFNFVLKNGKMLNSADLENPFVSSIAEMAMPGNNDKFSWTMNSGDYKKFKDEGVKQGMVNLINNAIKGREGDEVTVDLSRYNGLACDLASTFVKPVLTKTIRFEKALPDVTFWITEESFSDLYRSFWLDRARLNDLAKEDQKNADLLLLGMNLADKNAEKQNVFKAKGRIEGLLFALKYKMPVTEDIRTMNTNEQWKQTFEYSKPATSIEVAQKMVIQYGDVYTVFAQ